MFISIWLLSVYFLIAQWSEWSWFGLKGVMMSLIVFLSMALATRENRSAVRRLERAIWNYLVIQWKIFKKRK